MTCCGSCKHCFENNICNGDCSCEAREIEISKDDDIRFYGEKADTSCEQYEALSD